MNVFEVRGVYLFRTDEEVPAALDRHYNETADRYELPTEAELSQLDQDFRLVEDMDRFRVRFQGDPPPELLRASLHFEDAPGLTTLLMTDEEWVAEAVDAGGERVGDED